MTKYIKITDTASTVPAIGYHDVEDDYVLPLSSKYDTFEFVTEKEARENHPAIFGAVDAETVAPKKDTKKVEEVKK